MAYAAAHQQRTANTSTSATRQPQCALQLAAGRGPAHVTACCCAAVTPGRVGGRRPQIIAPCRMHCTFPRPLKPPPSPRQRLDIAEIRSICANAWAWPPPARPHHKSSSSQRSTVTGACLSTAAIRRACKTQGIKVARTNTMPHQASAEGVSTWAHWQARARARPLLRGMEVSCEWRGRSTRSAAPAHLIARREALHQLPVVQMERE
jgi:hypothetical protein